MWILAEDWQVITCIYRFMYRWINIWLNVVEHVMIEYTGMMSWLFPALELKKYNTMQDEVRGHHQSLGHRVQRMVSLVWLILAVCAGTNFISVKMSLAASTTLCGAINPKCNRTWPGPSKPVGQQDESSIGFQRRNDSQDHLHIQACRASHSHVGREESSQGEELGAKLQPGSWHAGHA